MNLLVYLFLLIAGCICLQYVRGVDKKDADAGFILLSDLPDLLNKLYSTGNNGSYFVLSVPGTEDRDGYFANIQFCMEECEVGLEWVLLAERNIQDKEEFLNIISEYGLEAKELSCNGTDCIRVENTRELLVSVASEIFKKMYRVTDSTSIRLAITDFLWR